jgi:hypothetical protein
MILSRYVKLLLLLLLLSPGLIAQERLGLVNSNYSGSAGISINPASIANSKIRVDYGLFTIHSFLENNYFYLPAQQGGLFRVLNGSYDFPYFDKPYGEGSRNVYSYYMDPSNKNIYANTRIDGPSVMFGLDDHIIAVHSSMRVASSTRRLPYDIANFSYYAMDFYPQHNIYYERDNYAMASMGWYEVGVTYATVLARPFKTLWSGGITLNWVGGYGGAYVEGRETDYIVYNDSILNVDYLDAELGFSLPVNYETDQVRLFNNMLRGNGFSADLGITFQYRDKPYMRRYKGMYYRKHFEDYLYKISFAILDIGWIGFKKQAQQHSYDGVSNHHINVQHITYDNIQDEVWTVSELLYGDPEASYRGDAFRVYMPLALSLQFDYHPSGPWFINGTFVTRLPVYKPMVERPIVLALTPRYETMEFEVSLPIVFYDMYYPRIGIAVRFYGLTVGTDNLGGFLGYMDFTGYDFYIGYKINFSGQKRAFTSRRNPCWFN